MPIYRSVTELIGRTPLLELCNYERNHGLHATLLAKLEARMIANKNNPKKRSSMMEKLAALQKEQERIMREREEQERQRRLIERERADRMRARRAYGYR